jgi:hypothetical protein
MKKEAVPAYPPRRFPGQHSLLILSIKDFARLVSEKFFFSGTHSLLGLKEKKSRNRVRSRPTAHSFINEFFLFFAESRKLLAVSRGWVELLG